MGIREIRTVGDDCLRKVCKPVGILTPRLRVLIDDMFDTMYEACGVGLAAPQVGVLRRIAVVDIGDDDPLVLINPEVLETSGEQTGEEGCLSLPGKAALVSRPNYAKVKAYDENMKEFIVEGEGLKARALLHEIDHLDGHMYMEKAIGDIHDAKYDDEEEE